MQSTWSDVHPVQFSKILDPNGGSLKLAGIGSRFVAALIDGIILGVINVPITFLVFEGHFTGNLSGMLIQFLYFTFMESSPSQATLGKQLMNIHVVNEQGKRLSTQQAAGRAAGRILSGIILAIGYIMALFDNENRALHDQLAKTRVISDQQSLEQIMQDGA